MPLTEAVAILGGSALSALGNIYSSERNVSQAKRQMRFQERMSNTAHQREIADLQKAGLNPILTGKYGGASTPPGTAGTVGNPLESMPSSALAFAQLRQQKPLVAAQAQQALSSAKASEAQAQSIALDSQIKAQEYEQRKITNPLQIKKLQEEVNYLAQNIKLSGEQKNKLIQEIKNLKEEFHHLKVIGKMWESANTLTPDASWIKAKYEALLKALRIGDPISIDKIVEYKGSFFRKPTKEEIRKRESNYPKNNKSK